MVDESPELREIGERAGTLDAFAYTQAPADARHLLEELALRDARIAELEALIEVLRGEVHKGDGAIRECSQLRAANEALCNENYMLRDRRVAAELRLDAALSAKAQSATTQVPDEETQRG